MADKYSSELIDLYLSGRMPKEEHRAFSEAIASDPVLQEEVQQFRLEQAALQLLLADEYRAKVRQWSEPEFEKIRSEAHPAGFRILRLPVQLLYAAAVAAFLVVGAFWWSNVRFSNSAVAARNFIDPRPELLSAFKGGQQIGYGSPVDPLVLDQVKTAYQAGDYARGIALLQGQVISGESAYFLAHLQLAAGDFRQAINGFQRVINEKGLLQTKAEYYSLLARLRANQTDADFYRLLDAIADDPAHPYREQAVTVRMSLKKGWRRLVW